MLIVIVTVLASVAVTRAAHADAPAGPGACAAATAAYDTAEKTGMADANLKIQEQAQLADLQKQLEQLEAQMAADQATVNQYNSDLGLLNKDQNTAANDVNDLLGTVTKTIANIPKSLAFAGAKITFGKLATALEGISATYQKTFRTIIAQQAWADYASETASVVSEVSVSVTIELSGLAALAATSLNFVSKVLFLATATHVFITAEEYAIAALAARHFASQLQQLQPAYDAATAALEQESAQETTLLNSIKEEEDAIAFLNETITADDAASAADRQQVAAACSAPTPLPPPGGGGGSQANTNGDPHLVTFDGARYDFQQVGEFVLSKSTVDGFQIQVRQQPWAMTSCTVAENSAFAFSVGGQTVSVYAGNPGLTTLVNGSQVSLVSGTPYALPGGGTITNNAAAAQETVAWPNGSAATVGYGGGFYLALNVTVADSEKGHLVGLLGTDGGDAANDLVTSDGTVLPYPAIASDAATRYGAFAAGWRLTQADSLFTYGSGQSTASFTDTSFPCQIVDLGTVSTAALDSATAQCQAAGVTQEPFLDDCALDVAVTGDTTVAESDAQAESAALGSSPPAGTHSITLASGNAAIGAADPAVTVEDSCAGTITQATVVAPYPGAWETPLASTQWDSVNSGYTGCNETFTTTFTLPAGVTDPQITVTDLADNSANVAVNGNQPFITGTVAGQCQTDFSGAPASGSPTSGLAAGVNTLTFSVDNCGGGSPTGVDFSATVTYNTTASS